jgi:hypothetical protein
MCCDIDINGFGFSDRLFFISLCLYRQVNIFFLLEDMCVVIRDHFLVLKIKEKVVFFVNRTLSIHVEKEEHNKNQ